MRRSVSHADLVRIVATMSPEHLALTAPMLGYRLTIPSPKAFNDCNSINDVGVGDAERNFSPSFEAVTGRPREFEPSRFWRAEAATYPHPRPEAEPQIGERPTLTHDDLVGKGRTMIPSLPTPPLASWARLWPTLRRMLQCAKPGHEVDVKAVVRSLVRGNFVGRVPKLPRKHWSERVEVWVDRSERLAPFWDDQDDVLARLQRTIGEENVRVRWLDGGAQAATYVRSRDMLGDHRCVEGVPVLVLGDLGAHEGGAVCDAWHNTALRLSREGVRASALLACGRDRCDVSLASEWSAIPWEPSREHKLGTPSQRVLWLLTLASPAELVQLGLLRALRRLLPQSRSDPSAEVDALRCRAMVSAGTLDLALTPRASKALRRRFAKKVDADTKRSISELIAAWHAELPAEYLRVESLVWCGIVGDSGADAPGDMIDAIAFADRVAESLRVKGNDDRFANAIKRAAKRMLDAMPSRSYQRTKELGKIWAVLNREEQGAEVPEGVDALESYRAIDGTRMATTVWSVRHVSSSLVLSQQGDSRWPSEREGPGSPVGLLHVAAKHIWVKRDDRCETQYPLQDGLAIPLENTKALTLHGGCEIREIALWSKEPWMRATGRDRYGLWCDVELAGVTFRMRWISAGRFVMGSPEQETGRMKDEQQHEVVLTEGFWLGETPVTQSLWEAVMDGNPSRFKGGNRPVETVSYVDCGTFFDRVRQLNGELELGLPTEAQWEYACRAGTSAATWLGASGELGQNKRPLVESIAWYAGNRDMDQLIPSPERSTGTHVKVYEIAEDLKLDSDLVLQKIHALGISVKNKMSKIDYAYVDQIMASLLKERQANVVEVEVAPGVFKLKRKSEYLPPRLHITPPVVGHSSGTRAVGTRSANPLGLYDMLGNVWEWCADLYAPYNTGLSVNPKGPDHGTTLVLRGGSWYAHESNIRAATRNSDMPNSRHNNVGFRLRCQASSRTHSGSIMKISPV